MNGIILVDKPAGWTSHDVVGKLRGLLHERRIGHSGTLDPMATGLLVVFVGRATRAVQFAEADTKRYIAGIKLGVTTDTQDTSGNVLNEKETHVSRGELEAALGGFRGKIQQIPPMYSAVKIGGKKLYELARKGKEVERKPREIEIISLEVTDGTENDFVLDVRCSKGTYIRTLCNDIGDALGCGGCMSSLRRIQAGAFCIENAHSIEGIKSSCEDGTAEELILPVDTLFAEYPRLTVSEKTEKKLRCGNLVSVDAADGLCRVYSQTGEFLLLGKVEGGSLITVKNFFEVIDDR